MKLRKHLGNKTYTIRWSQRTPKRVETHVGRGGKSERVVTGGEFKPRCAAFVIGPNPTATLNAFLFGRDRTNIKASIEAVTLQIYCVKTGTRRPATAAEIQNAVSLSARL